MSPVKFLWMYLLLAVNSVGIAREQFVSGKYTQGSLAIARQNTVASLLLDGQDFPGVIRIAKSFQDDLGKVTGSIPKLDYSAGSGNYIIIGTIGKSKFIDQLIAARKIDVGEVAGHWESTLIQVVYQPFPGVDSALVIAGSDKRGTIYGMYELSYQSGVSPWYYWADVPVKKNKELYISGGRHVIASPAVKYRGIFLNDEAPALAGWVKEKTGGFNHLFYEKVFELILRMRGNYLWPAMWGNAFNDDDTLNPILADEYGIVMGTSHHEPMLRAQTEWKRYGKGEWNYEHNSESLREFWTKGIQNMGTHESIVTVGMRGDGDMPMSEESNIQLLEKIVNDQREILTKITGKKAEEIPQLWALYKEVQDYYDRGMRVPDDITLLLCDDNWGNIRKLPKLHESPRSGGYGIYYHFDYVGGPRNYKWINTNPIQKVWEQMHLAYEYDATKIWIVNVGDLKPMEFPIEFFLDYASAPAEIPAEKLREYSVNWCENQFGANYAVEIADILDTYLKFNGRHKPELLNQNTYSLNNYKEFESIVASYQVLLKKTDYIYNQLPLEYRDAYYQLIHHPVEAMANLHEMYYAVGLNHQYAKQGRVRTNELAKKARSLYDKDAAITHYYNQKLASGKWNHFMDQTHIGYTYWQQPEVNSMPKVDSIVNSPKAILGLAIEGHDSSWTGISVVNGRFPDFNFYSNESHYFELFNKGNQAINFQIKAPNYIKIALLKGTIKDQQRIDVNIDWAMAPSKKSKCNIIISGNGGSKITLPINLDNTRFSSKKIQGFVESDGYVSMEAIQYSRMVNARPIRWQVIPNYGKTLGGITPIPVTAAPQAPGGNSAHLEFNIFVSDTGKATIAGFISPTIDFTNSDGLKYAISIDDEKPVVMNISKDYVTNKAWEKSVADNIKILTTPVRITKPGPHVVKYWMVDPGVVLQKLVLDFGNLRSSDLGPPSTFEVGR